jgi:hypothetical protein
MSDEQFLYCYQGHKNPVIEGVTTCGICGARLYSSQREAVEAIAGKLSGADDASQRSEPEEERS